MNCWTLEYHSVEKSFADWGLSQDSLGVQLANLAADTVTVRVPGAMDRAVEFAYGEAVIIRRDRSLGEDAYSGGSIYFQGKTTRAQRVGSGGEEEIVYQFAGPWWDFERVVFQQVWVIATGWANNEYSYTNWNSSEVFLGRTSANVAQSTGAQIAEAVNWAITCGVNVQLGTIDPATMIPSYNSRDITVAEVIIQMLRWTPDAVGWFDYTTTPPTFHVRKLANLTEVAITAANTNVPALQLTPRNDLVLPAVCLRFKSIGAINGVPFTTFTDQFYPETATGQELGASVHTIELAGWSVNNVYGELVCAACGAQDASNANRVAWWQSKDATLSSAKVDPASIAVSSAVIVDANGATVSLGSYPNELLKGQIAEWMTYNEAPVVGVEATVKAQVSYHLYWKDSGWLETHKEGFMSEMVRTRELSCRIKLTNGVTGNYSATESATSAESMPAGLAKDIYDAHQVLQYAGEIDLVGAEVVTTVGMGSKLKINTGAAEYANLMVQGITKDLGSGLVKVAVGPASHLGIADLVELLRVNRNRLTINNPSARAGSAAGGSGTVVLGKDTQLSDTVGGNGDRALQALSSTSGANTTVIRNDATVGALTVEVLDAAGDRVTDSKAIELKLADLANAATGAGGTASLKRVHWTTPAGAKKRAYALFTTAASDETSDGHDAGSDISIGGGAGGGLELMIVGVLHDDYLECQKTDGVDIIDEEEWFNVAKPYALRGGESVHLVPGDYTEGDLVLVATANYTGVKVTEGEGEEAVEVELTRIDANLVTPRVLGRELHWFDANTDCKEYMAYVAMTPPVEVEE